MLNAHHMIILLCKDAFFILFKPAPCVFAISPRLVKMNCDVRRTCRFGSFLRAHTHRHSSSPFRLII